MITSASDSETPSAKARDDPHRHGEPLRTIPEHLQFADLFSLNDIQRIQDGFATAANVASLITDPQGRPLTQPSRFTALCRLVRGTPQGLANCMRSDAELGLMRRNGPTLFSCFSCGLLDGGTGIFVGQRHIANWLIGQVFAEDTDIERITTYAAEIGVDETAFREALAKVPRMPRERFREICQALFQFANHLSTLALRGYRREQLIATLRQARASLRARDRRLADIIDFLPDPTLALDETGAVVFWNRALEQMTGIHAKDMLGKRNFEGGSAFYGNRTPLLADYARGAVPAPDARYLIASVEPGAIIAEVDLRLPAIGQRRIWAKAVALRDEAGHITGAIESIRDITDKHQAAKALRESEEKYRRIVETANEGVWVVDKESKTVFANRRMAFLLGLTPSDMLGRRPEEFLSRAQTTDFHSHIAQQLQGISESYELLFIKNDGSRIWTLVSASPLHDATGTVVGSLGMFTDITDRKRAEAALAEQHQHLEEEVERRTRDLRNQALELAEANIRLSELDRLKSLFLSTVSHELRTPLTSILGFAKLCARDFQEHFLPLVTENPGLANKGKRIGDNLRVVFQEAGRLTRLINDVLDLSRIESGSMEWSDQRIDARPIVHQTGQTLDGMLADRPDISADLDLAPGPYPVRFDRDQLVQVLTNLLDNAVKFTQAGSVRLTAHLDATSLLLAVHDTGVGIPPDELEAIFDKFHQLRRGDTVDDTNKGTGLGLAICRQIVRHYGGRIWAESEPGRGSRFYVRLPLVEE